MSDEIVRLTGGHIRLTKLAVEAFFSSSDPISNLSSFLLSQKAVLSALDNIWQAFTPSEQVCLATGKDERSCKDYFEQVGLTKNGDIQIPLFTEYLLSIAERILHEEQKLMYEPATNLIKKGWYRAIRPSYQSGVSAPEAFITA